MPDDADEESEDDDENSEGDEEESEADEEDVKSEAVPDTLELDEEEWGKMVINAERFKTLGERRLIRFASVFERAVSLMFSSYTFFTSIINTNALPGGWSQN